MKSDSLLLENPFCLYPGELHGSPTTALGDDELSRHCREFLTPSFTQSAPPRHFRRRPSPQSFRGLLHSSFPQSVFPTVIPVVC